MSKVSILIPSLNRPEGLARVQDSLKSQTFRDFETIILQEEGPLTYIRNKGLKSATGDIVAFIDDDVYLPPHWLEGILSGFKNESIAGVSGPAVITWKFRKNRDLFKYTKIKKIYDVLFLDGMEKLPGRITRAGAWTTGACLEGIQYEGEVEFLEACNMAYRREILTRIGGFDESYAGIGDWSEPDASFRIRKLGYKLWFTTKAKLYHEPSQSGAFKKRAKDSPNRLSNYYLFASRWVRPHWRHTLYKAFLETYYAIKTFER